MFSCKSEDEVSDLLYRANTTFEDTTKEHMSRIAVMKATVTKTHILNSSLEKSKTTNMYSRKTIATKGKTQCIVFCASILMGVFIDKIPKHFPNIYILKSCACTYIPSYLK